MIIFLIIYFLYFIEDSICKIIFKYEPYKKRREEMKKELIEYLTKEN